MIALHNPSNFNIKDKFIYVPNHQTIVVKPWQSTSNLLFSYHKRKNDCEIVTAISEPQTIHGGPSGDIMGSHKGTCFFIATPNRFSYTVEGSFSNINVETPRSINSGGLSDVLIARHAFIAIYSKDPSQEFTINIKPFSGKDRFECREIRTQFSDLKNEFRTNQISAILVDSIININNASIRTGSLNLDLHERKRIEVRFNKTYGSLMIHNKDGFRSFVSDIEYDSSIKLFNLKEEKRITIERTRPITVKASFVFTEKDTKVVVTTQPDDYFIAAEASSKDIVYPSNYTISNSSKPIYVWMTAPLSFDVIMRGNNGEFSTDGEFSKLTNWEKIENVSSFLALIEPTSTPGSYGMFFMSPFEQYSNDMSFSINTKIEFVPSTAEAVIESKSTSTFTRRRIVAGRPR